MGACRREPAQAAAEAGGSGYTENEERVMRTEEDRPAGSRSERRRAVASMLAAALLLVAVGCGASESGGGGAKEGEGGKPAKLRIGYQVIPNGAPIVKNQGWLEKELGIPVEWQQFDSGANVNRAIASGGIDVGLAGSSPVANGIASGLPYKVAWIYDIIGDAEQLVVKKDAGVSDIAGLKGKKIAAPFGSTTHYSLLTTLQDAGLDPASDVDVLDLEPDDIDAAYTWNPSLAKLKDDGKVLVSSAELAKQGTLTGDIGIVRADFAEKYPDAVTAWVKQQDRAVQLYKDDPDAAAKIVGKEFSLPPKDALEQMKGLIWLTAAEQLTPEYLGTPGQPGALVKQLTTTAKFLKQQKLIDRGPSADEFNEAVDLQFVQKASGA